MGALPPLDQAGRPRCLGPGDRRHHPAGCRSRAASAGGGATGRLAALVGMVPARTFTGATSLDDHPSRSWPPSASCRRVRQCPPASRRPPGSSSPRVSQPGQSLPPSSQLLAPGRRAQVVMADGSAAGHRAGGRRGSGGVQGPADREVLLVSTPPRGERPLHRIDGTAFASHRHRRLSHPPVGTGGDIRRRRSRRAVARSPDLRPVRHPRARPGTAQPIRRRRDRPVTIPPA